MEEWNRNHGRKLSRRSQREDNSPLVVAMIQGLLQKTSNNSWGLRYSVRPMGIGSQFGK